MGVVPEIRLDDEDTPVVKLCPHLKKACRPRRVEPKIREFKNTNLRSCKACVKETPRSDKVPESAQLWLCLGCGSLLCGRYDKGHAAKHHERFGDSDCLMWNIESYSCWCYLCDDNILTAPHRNEALVQIQKYWQKHAEGAEISLDTETSLVEARSLDYKVISPGLQNLGNTCFFNSVTQLLASIEQLHEIISPHPFTERSTLEIRSSSPLTVAFCKVLNEIYSADKEKIVIRPNALFAEIHNKFPRFTKGVQQDAQELLHYLFDGLKSDEMAQKQDGRPEIKRSRSRRKTTGEEEFELQERHSDKDKKHAWKPSSYIESIFEGRLASIVVCSTCNSISTTYDQFEELSLSIVQEKQHNKERKGRFRAAFEDISRRGRNSLSLTRNPSIRSGASMSRQASKNDSDGELPTGAQSPRMLRSTLNPNAQVSMSEAVSEEEAEDAAAVEKQLKAHTFSMSEAKNRLMSFAAARKSSVDYVQNEGSLVSPLSPGQTPKSPQTQSADIPPASLERLQYIQRLLHEPEHQEPKGSLEDSLRDFTTVECLENDNAFACEECAKLLYPPQPQPPPQTIEDEEMSTSPDFVKRPSVSAGSMMDIDLPESSMPQVKKAGETADASPKHIMRKAYKRFLVADLPNILILHLKRFQQSGKSIYSSLRKNDAVVSFDEELDMTPFLMPPPMQENLSPQQSARYRCVGAIVHIGTINSGHYVAYFLTHKVLGAGEALGNETGSKQREWVFASDAMTRACSWAEVSKSRAYMIFYERIV